MLLRRVGTGRRASSPEAYFVQESLRGMALLHAADPDAPQVIRFLQGTTGFNLARLDAAFAHQGWDRDQLDGRPTWRPRSSGVGRRTAASIYWHGTTFDQARKLRHNPQAHNLFVAEDRERAEEYAFRAARKAGEPALLKLRVADAVPDSWAEQEASSAGLEGHLGQWVVDGPVEVLRVFVWSWDAEAWRRL